MTRADEGVSMTELWEHIRLKLLGSTRLDYSMHN